MFCSVDQKELIPEVKFRDEYWFVNLSTHMVKTIEWERSKGMIIILILQQYITFYPISKQTTAVHKGGLLVTDCV